MKTTRFEIGDQTTLRIQADSDAAIKGWDESVIELTLDGDLDECQTQEQDQLLILHCRAAMSVRVPPQIAIHIPQVAGDLSLFDLNNSLSVDAVAGDCALHAGCADVSVSQVHGGLTVENLTGDLQVGQVHSDMRLTHLTGAVTLNQVGGDVRAHHINGNLKIGLAQGDVRVRGIGGRLVVEEMLGDFKGDDLNGGMQVSTHGDLVVKTALTPGQSYVGHADGDISMRVPSNSNAHFTLEACGGISTRLLQVAERDSGCVVGQMGDGEAQVTLQAQGHLSLKPKEAWEDDTGVFSTDFGLADLGETLSSQIQSQIAQHLSGIDMGELARTELEKAMRKIESQAGKIERHAEEHARRAQEHARREAERAQERAQRQAERAQREVERAQERAQREMERAHRRMEPGREPTRRWNISINTQETSKSKASPEEQLAILRMLQNGQITAQEAEMLLQALEK